MFHKPIQTIKRIQCANPLDELRFQLLFPIKTLQVIGMVNNGTVIFGRIQNLYLFDLRICTTF